jgi:hypothetical protein
VVFIPMVGAKLFVTDAVAKDVIDLFLTQVVVQ